MKLRVVHIPDLLLKLGNGWTESELCRIHTLTTQKWDIEVPGGDALLQFSVYQLKRLLEDMHGHPVEDQTVRFRGRILKDEETLASCGVTPGASVLMGLSSYKPWGDQNGDASTGSGCRCAEYRGSLTMTEAAVSEKDGGESSPKADPWWRSSRLSGPNNARRSQTVDTDRARHSTSEDWGRGAQLGAGMTRTGMTSAPMAQTVHGRMQQGMTSVPMAQTVHGRMQQGTNELQRKNLQSASRSHNPGPQQAPMSNRAGSALRPQEHGVSLRRSVQQGYHGPSAQGAPHQFLPSERAGALDIPVTGPPRFRGANTPAGPPRPRMGPAMAKASVGETPQTGSSQTRASMTAEEVRRRRLARLS